MRGCWRGSSGEGRKRRKPAAPGLLLRQDAPQAACGGGATRRAPRWPRTSSVGHALPRVADGGFHPLPGPAGIATLPVALRIAFDVVPLTIAIAGIRAQAAPEAIGGRVVVVGRTGRRVAVLEIRAPGTVVARDLVSGRRAIDLD